VAHNVFVLVKFSLGMRCGEMIDDAAIPVSSATSQMLV